MSKTEKSLDGYIKFCAIHKPDVAPAHPMLAELDALRTTLFDSGWLGQSPEGIGFGNISLRANYLQQGVNKDQAQPNAFIITATGTGGARKLGPDGYCLVCDFDLSANSVKSRGPLKPSSESMSHGAIYRAAPSVMCIAHLHSLELYNCLLAAGAPSTPIEAAFGTPHLAMALENLVAKSPLAKSPMEVTIIMKGHVPGIIFYAPSLQALQACFNFLQNLAARQDLMPSQTVPGQTHNLP